MSFHFDNSSTGEDEDIDLDAFDDTGLLALSSRQSVAAATAHAAASPGNNASSDDAESDVDWEDADEHDFDDAEEDNDVLDEKLLSRKFPSQGVTITFSSASNTPVEGLEQKQEKAQPTQNDVSAKKRKRSTVRVLRDVPYHTQQLIVGARRSHLLCCIARSMRCSALAGIAKSQSNGANALLDEDEESRSLLLHLAHSLVPAQFHTAGSNIANQPGTIHTDPSKLKCKYTIPTNRELRDFSEWFFQFVNAGDRRREAIQRNVARGASAAADSPTLASNLRRTRRSTSVANTRNRSARRQEQSTPRHEANGSDEHDFNSANFHEGDSSSSIPCASNLLNKVMYLSPYYDHDPQLFLNDGIDVIRLVESITPLELSLIFLAMTRSLGWRSRFISAFDPLPLQLTVDHPLLELNNTTATKVKTNTSLSQCLPLVQNMIRLMKEGGVLTASSSTNAAKKSRTDAVDLVSSSDEKETSNKKQKHQNSSRKPKRIKSELSSEPVGLERIQVDHSLSWIEVLCTYDENKSKRGTSVSQKSFTGTSQARWVSILPYQKSFDTPLDIEFLLAQLEEHSNDKIAALNVKGSNKYQRRSKSSKGSSSRKPVSYVLAVEHYQTSSVKTQVRLSDVTPRYANSWSHTLRLRGASGKEIVQGGGQCVDGWWDESLKAINDQYRFKSPTKLHLQSNNASFATKTKTSDGKEVEVFEIASSEDDEHNGQHLQDSDQDDIVFEETKELAATITKEPIPSSKAAFKSSSQYVIPSVLNSQDVLHPDASKHICGVFKGEPVYRRRDVSKALRAKKWLYEGRKVKDSELERPIKKVKARKKRSSAGFQALTSYVSNPDEPAPPTKYADDEEEEMDSLYGIWQTKPWSPPRVGPTDTIPVNEYKNVELALINPGLTHMEQPRLSQVARKLGIPYAPCMLGFEGHKGTRTPSVRGIVVHSHNVELLNEAYAEYESQLVESEVAAKRRDILKKWKRLVVGILTKDRLDQAYGT